jgi:VanZ family protein
MHFCEYGFLAFLAFLTFTGTEFKISYRKSIMILICLILFAILDEYHQKLIPGRSFSIKDILSNISGILLVSLFTLITLRIIEEKIKHR